MDAKTLLADQLQIHAKAFLKGLTDTPEEIFAITPPAGGHSVAWHALHIADWQRILISPGLKGVQAGETFAHLGWEESDFARSVFGASPASESDPKDHILEHVRAELERGVQDIMVASDDQLHSRVQTPMGERVVLSMIQTQIRHIPYHWGQAMMTRLQLSRAKL
jgi:hypothetical protein